MSVKRRSQELLPVLHEITKSGAYRFTAAGAAQVCLARLGDSIALEQLKNELNGQKANENAIYKLVRVQTDESVGINFLAGGRKTLTSKFMTLRRIDI